MKGPFLQASALSTIILIAGCSSMTELKTEDISSKQVPDWYLEHETRSTKTWFFGEDKYYAAAVAVSPDMEMAIKKAMEVLGKRYKERTGGYTRIVKLGTRQGDGAEIAQIELI